MSDPLLYPMNLAGGVVACGELVESVDASGVEVASSVTVDVDMPSTSGVTTIGVEVAVSVDGVEDAGM